MENLRKLKASEKVAVFPAMSECKAKAKPHATFACSRLDGEINIFQCKTKLSPTGKPVIERNRAAVSDENFNMNFEVQ